jgi:plasmid stabilization system protein ParE
MKRRIIKKPQADRDLLDHFIYIGRDNERAALLFLEEAGAAFERIADMPGAGPAWQSDDPRLHNIRHKAVSRRFRNYLIFYLAGDNFIEILTIVHGMRDLPSLLRDLA